MSEPHRKAHGRPPCPSPEPQLRGTSGHQRRYAGGSSPEGDPWVLLQGTGPHPSPGPSCAGSLEPGPPSWLHCALSPSTCGSDTPVAGPWSRTSFAVSPVPPGSPLRGPTRRQRNAVSLPISQTLAPSPAGLLPIALRSCCLWLECVSGSLNLSVLLCLLGPLHASVGLLVPVAV